MKSSTSRFLVPFALCAMGVFAFVFTGCEKREASSDVPPNAPESYLKDKAFMTNLVARKAARDDLAKVHAKLVAKMKEKVDAKLAELKVVHPTAADLAKAKAELEKDPEWNSLYKRCEDAAQAIEENRRDAMRAVGRRIAPPRKKDKKNGDLK